MQLQVVMQMANLMPYIGQAEAWCIEMGAAFLNEILQEPGGQTQAC